MPNDPNRKIPTDPMAQRFLGPDLDKIKVVAGQRANEQKQLAAHEQYLFAEACEYGDDLVRYVMGHHRLQDVQRVWGYALAVFCLRRDYPEGVTDFDELFDKGGADLELQKKNIVKDPERIKAITEALPPFTLEVQQEAAGFAEHVSKYIESTKHRGGLSNAQAAYALGRAFHNMRFGFPLERGGTAAFDAWVTRASAYFERYKT